MNEKDKIRIRHILDAIAEIEEYTQGFTEEKFIEHRLVRNATIRQFEIIGEAANAISIECMNANPEIPWRILVDFRNVLIHQYFGVNFKQVFKVIQEELPELKINLLQIKI
ncbi:MAG: DUF86 domain-containing protein [Leptospiraceae bacterium]|nr:DUF86 domain-containing protein [Leptospiraceae bacterium]